VNQHHCPIRDRPTASGATSRRRTIPVPLFFADRNDILTAYFAVAIGKSTPDWDFQQSAFTRPKKSAGFSGPPSINQRTGRPGHQISFIVLG
jgi:hypothetical protein